MTAPAQAARLAPEVGARVAIRPHTDPVLAALDVLAGGSGEVVFVLDEGIAPVYWVRLDGRAGALPFVAPDLDVI